MRIIGIDPGVETGWAYGTLTPGEGVHIERHGHTPWRPFVMRIHDRMMNFEEEGFDILVVEDWRLTKKGAQVLLGSDLPSSQCLGAIRLSYDLARRNGHRVRMTTQMPATKYVVDGWMSDVPGWLPESDVDHNKDAIRHVVYYALNALHDFNITKEQVTRDQ